MPKYNPNSIWESRKKEARYDPPDTVVKAQPTAQTPTAEPFFKKPPAEQFEDAPAGNSHLLLWSILIFIVILTGGLLYFLFLRQQTGLNVSISFIKPDQVLVGDQFTLSVSLANDSQGILKNADLSVTLPNNVSFVGQPPSQRVMDQAVGDVGPGSVNGHDFPLIVTGNPASVKHVDVKLDYNTVSAPKTQFETDGGVDLVVAAQPAISLTIVPPTTVVSGQDFDTQVTYHNNTGDSFHGVVLALQYPPSFSFTRSSVPADTAANNTWSLGTMPAAASGTITITGNVVGPQNASYAFAGNMTGSVSGQTYGLTSQTANVTTGAAPLSVAVTLNNTQAYVASLNDTLNYALTYTNTANVAFQNVTITAHLVGSMFDLTTLQSNGSFNSITDTVTWYAANTPQLLNLGPGQSGSVTLQVKTKTAYPIKLLSDNDYTLGLDAQIASPTVPAGTAASSTVSAVSVENKVGSQITIAAKGYWHDPSSGLNNSGPYPPKVNQPTQYTIHWIITNYSDDAGNVAVSATLQSGTTCTGQIQSNMPTAPTCNSATGLVQWTIPTVPATTGITGPPAEAVIQVQNTPAVNQVGQSLTLLGPTTLSATDTFTSSTLSASDAPVTTDLPDDTSVPSNQNRQVTQ